MAKQENKKPASTPKSKPTPAPFLGGKESEKAAKKYLQDLEKAQLEQTDLNDIAKELSATWKDLATAIGNVDKNQKILGDNTKDYQRLIKDVYANIKKIGTENFEDLKVQDKLKKLQEERKDIYKDLEEKTQSLKDTDDQIVKLTEKRNKLEAIAYKSLRKGNEATFDKATAALEAVKAQLAEGEHQRDILKTQKATLETTQAQVIAAHDLVEPLSHAADMIKQAHEKAEEFGIDLDEMSKHMMEPFEKALGFLDKVPGGGLMKSFFGVDKKLEVVQKAVMDSFITGLATTGSVGTAAFGALRAGAMSFMTALGPILVPLIAISAIAFALKEAFDMDKEVTEMARGLGISKDEATEIHHELIDIASTTDVVGASAKELGKEYQALAKSFGTAKMANAEMAETQVYLNKQLGMSSDEAAEFQKMSMGTGRTAYQNLAVIEAGVESMTGGLMNYKEVAQDIAKSSKAVQASYKGNIAALTKAVVTAKKFGMTLDQTKKSADAILDVESSLEAEMKANVLTGKNMNLNAARELALKGDTAAAMEEMMQQAGGYDELMEMAPYQQKAVADAMGMSVEEMIKAAEHQKNLNTMAEELGITLDKNGKMSEEEMQRALASNNEEAKKLAMQQQQTAMTEKLSAMGDKLMTVFMKLADPIMEMLQPLIDLVEFVFPAIETAISIAFFPLKVVLKTIGLVVDVFEYVFGVIGRIGSAINKYLGDPIGKIVDFVTGLGDSISNFFGGIFDGIKNAIKDLLPDWALSILGFGDDKEKSAAPKKSETAEKVHDAVIDPNGGLVVKGAKGTYQLNPDDSIVAGTDLESGGSSPLEALSSAMTAPLDALSSIFGGREESSSNKEVVALLKELIAKVDQPMQVNINGAVIDQLERQASIKRTYNTKVDSAYGATG